MWRGLEYDGLERLRLEEGGMVRASSVIDSARGRYAYELTAERDWTFRRLQLEALAGERTLTIEFDGGAPGASTASSAPTSPTRSTSTWRSRRSPTRCRSAGSTSRSTTRPTSRSPTCPSPTSRSRSTSSATPGSTRTCYLFESLDSDFSREIEVDLDGVVVDYSGTVRTAVNDTRSTPSRRCDRGCSASRTACSGRRPRPTTWCRMPGCAGRAPTVPRCASRPRSSRRR